MKERGSTLLQKEGTKSVLASLIAILIGLAVGAIIILIVGIFNPSLGIKGALEGVQLVFGGLFSTGRSAAGALTFGFNSTNMGNMLFRATPLILTGLSVAVAFKTGLFDGYGGHFDPGPIYPHQRGACSPGVGDRFCGRMPGWRHLGLYPRPGQGLPQHQ